MSETAASTTSTPPSVHDLALADYCDPVIEFYKKDVDRTLLRENLKLTVEQRIRKAMSFHESLEGWREAGRLSRLAKEAVGQEGGSSSNSRCET